MKKTLLFLTILFLLFSSFSFAENGFLSLERKNLKFDESLTSSSEINYQRPRQIFVAHIKPGNNYLLNDTAGWMRLLHYYITTRLEFPDMPFNYIIDSSGNIYEALEDAEGRKAHMDVEDGTVMVGYLSESPDFSPSAQRGFKDLIENYSYKFGIPRRRVLPVEFIISEDSLLPSHQPAEGGFRISFLDMTDKFEYSSESNLRFSGEVKNLNYERVVQAGEKLEVSLTLKNTDSFSWHIDEGFIFLATSDGEESPFAINQVWESFSRPLSLKGQMVLPDGEVELSFELDTEGVLPDEYELEFKFVTLPDIDVKGSKFSVNFEVEKGNRKVVQIRPTNTGALTVYSCPDHSCEMVAGAISGERYLVLEEENSWFKINVDGVEGWVIMHYATPVD